MKRFASLSLVLCSSFFLTGCDDLDFLIQFAIDWAKEDGYISENKSGVGPKYLPTGKTIGRAVFGTKTGDPYADAAIDIGVAVKGVAQTDIAINKADKALNSGDVPKYSEAMGHLNTAVDNRPNDWHARNNRGVVHLEQGATDAAKADFVRANNKCKEPALCTRQLQTRIDLLNESIERQLGYRELPRCTTYAAQADAYSSLGELYEPRDPKYAFYRQQEDAARAQSQDSSVCSDGI